MPDPDSSLAGRAQPNCGCRINVRSCHHSQKGLSMTTIHFQEPRGLPVGEGRGGSTSPCPHYVPLRDDYALPVNAVPYAASITPGPDYDPFDHIDALGFHVELKRLPLAVVGVTDFQCKTVFIHPWDDSGSMRTTAAHEVVHIERGPLSRVAALAAGARSVDCGMGAALSVRAEEDACNATAAARLLPFEYLLATARGVDSVEEIAEATSIDYPMVMARMSHLSRLEHDQILGVTQYAEHGSRLRRRSSLKCSPLKPKRSPKMREVLPW